MVFTIKYRVFLQIFPSSNSMKQRKNRDQPTDNMDFRWIYIDGCELGSGFNSPEHDWDVARDIPQ